MTYLQRFTRTGRRRDGFFWMYDRHNPANPTSVHVERAAAQNFLYVASEESGIKPRDLVERLLFYIDRPYGGIWRKLVHGPGDGLYQKLSPQEWLHLRTFLAVQHLRTPYHQQVAEGLASFSAIFGVRAQLEQPARLQEELRATSGKAVREELMHESRESLDRGELVVKPEKALWLQHLVEFGVHLSILIEHVPWKVVRACGNVEFPTSDLPVAMVSKRSKSGPYIFDGGWLRNDVEITLTLDPKHVLLLGPQVDGDHVGTEEWCRSVRTRTAHHSERFVFARSRHTSLEEVLRHTDPPAHVLEFGGEEYNISTEAIGSVVGRLFQDRSDLIRFGPRSGQVVGGGL